MSENEGTLAADPDVAYCEAAGLAVPQMEACPTSARQTKARSPGASRAYLPATGKVTTEDRHNVAKGINEEIRISIHTPRWRRTKESGGWSLDFDGDASGPRR